MSVDEAKNLGDEVEARKTEQDRGPNFRDDQGRIFLVRCYRCEPVRGRENWALAVSEGRCAWCGWREFQTESEAA